MTNNDIAKINRLRAKGWTANEIARVYGYRRSEVERVLLGLHRKSAAACKATWRANKLANEGHDPKIITACFGG